MHSEGYMSVCLSTDILATGRPMRYANSFRATYEYVKNKILDVLKWLLSRDVSWKQAKNNTGLLV